MNFRSLAARFWPIAVLILITGSLIFSADDPPRSSTLNYNLHMSHCENRWVALYHKPQDSDYTYGFVYIDPEAGFTLHFGGVLRSIQTANIVSHPIQFLPTK